MTPESSPTEQQKVLHKRGVRNLAAATPWIRHEAELELERKPTRAPVPLTDAMRERIHADRVALGLDPDAPIPFAEPAPDRALSAPERHALAEATAVRGTVWLPEPITDPVTGRRVFAYDPHAVPDWLAVELAK